ncbi:MAG: aminopeptidase P family protein, partial [Candidatus Aenigmarchaeota archaeon]|nr:aminopeptidase P family protein [Candidatus Aenigmarchaeota archaeon]
ITRMFVDKLGAERKKIYEDAKLIHDKIIDSLTHGANVEKINELQIKFFKRNGYKLYHSFGHGVGLTVHESIGDVLKKNMIVTVEPGIYVKNIGGFRIENMVLIKKGRSEILSKSI